MFYSPSKGILLLVILALSCQRIQCTTNAYADSINERAVNDLLRSGLPDGWEGRKDAVNELHQMPPEEEEEGWYFSNDIPSEMLSFITSSISISRHSKPADYWFVFTINKINGTCPILLMDSAGHILAGKYHTQCGWVPVVVNRTHILFSVHSGTDSWQVTRPGSDLRPFVWDLRTNTVTQVPAPNNGITYHHELIYNSQTQSFITMQQKPVAVGSHRSSPIYHDLLLEFNMRGELLWSWFSADHLNVSKRDIICKDTGLDPSLDIALHGNSLDWDSNSDTVLYTPRNLDTFYAIAKSTGKVRWSVGRLGTVRTHSFNHPHNIHWSGHNRFLLFDNDQRCDAKKGTRQSRFMELQMTKNKRVKVIWTGGEGAHLFSPYGGSCMRLESGHVVGVYSSRAAIVEVDAHGRLVQKIQFRHKGIPLGNILFAQVVESHTFGGKYAHQS